MKYLINHQGAGVFVGHGLGLAFFTNHDCAGQTRVVLFDEEHHAAQFVGEAFGEKADEYEIVAVNTDKDYLNASDLDQIGFANAASALRMEELRNFAPENQMM